MPEDVTRDLKAFTPVVPDRDALLFAAGKAAARRWAGWKWLTLALAATNAATLGVLFWPKPASPPSRPTAEPFPVVEPSEPYRPDPSSYIALRHGWDAPHRTSVAGESPAVPAAPLTPRSLSDPRFN